MDPVEVVPTERVVRQAVTGALLAGALVACLAILALERLAPAPITVCRPLAQGICPCTGKPFTVTCICIKKKEIVYD